MTNFKFSLILLFTATNTLPMIALAKHILLSPSRSKILPIEKDASIMIEDGEIIRVKDQGQHLVIFGKKIGQSLLTIGERIHRIEVVAKKDLSTYELLQEYCRKRRGLNLDFKDGNFEISGRLNAAQDWLDLMDLPIQRRPFWFRPKVSQLVSEKIKSSLQKIFEDNFLPPLRLRFSPFFTAFLPESLKKLREQYESILTPLGFKVEDHSLLNTDESLVEIELWVAEVRKGAVREIGLRPPLGADLQLADASSSIDSHSPSFFQQLSSSESVAKLRFLEESGMGQVLAKPKLVSQSGKKASFHSGGEFPIRSGSIYSGDISWKNHGILLNITPQVDISDKIHIEMSAEISSLDFSVNAEGVPGINTNKLKTYFTLESESTLALSGLYKLDRGESISGWPFISKIPILGLLFSTLRSTKAQMELVIFVTPRIIGGKNRAVIEKENEKVLDPKVEARPFE